MNKGRFITLEGTEGVGKSTNLAFIKQQLEARGVDYVQTREPGGTPLAEEIRALLLANRSEKVADDAELLLVFAARAQHLQTVIKPALDAGKWVLSDRFIDATYAYQGGGREMSVETIRQLEVLVLDGLKPDVTILLDMPVEVGLKRAGERSTPDRFETEKVAFFERVRQMYLSRAHAQPERYCIINADGTIKEVQSRLETALTQKLEQWHAT